MENLPATTTSTTNDFSFSNKNLLIIVLVFLLVLSFLGINLLIIIGNFINVLVNIFGPFVLQILTVFGFTLGSAIDTSSDIVANTAKTGIDIADGTLNSVADLLKGGKKSLHLDQVINTSPLKINEPSPDKASNPIQKPITAAKTNWCLVGEDNGKRGCIEIKEHDKCLSGQIFPEQKMCLNPNLTPNNNINNKK
jgi:hypothetical protein